MKKGSIDAMDEKTLTGYKTCEGLIGGKISDVELLPGGRNSAVYRVTTADGKELLLKNYLPAGPYHQDRAEVEFTAMEFLWRQGFRCIPRPTQLFLEKKVAIFEYLKGEKISPFESFQRF